MTKKRHRPRMPTVKFEALQSKAVTMSSSFGKLWRIITFGESHGGGIGVVIDGCPAGLRIGTDDIQTQLTRRRPGQNPLTTQRDEPDQVEILSGLQDGVTLGSPLALLVRNSDQRPADYAPLQNAPRPSHADFTYREKYGLTAASGGGRASARETIGRVAAGAVAEIWLREIHGVEIVAWVDTVGDADQAHANHTTVSRDQVDAHPTRCPDGSVNDTFAAAIEAARQDADSVGGVISCVCRGVPTGWGEPVFAKREAELARAMLSSPAAKGFESGSGFAGAARRGSANNDLFCAGDQTLATLTNHSGGIQGGISNGQPIFFRVAFKPPATIGQAQQTVDFDGNELSLSSQGRHDPCVVPRAVPIVEAMAALVLADLALEHRART